MEILKKISLKNKIVVINVLLISVVVAISYFITMPSVAEIKKMQSEIDAQKIDLEEKYQKGQSLKRLTESLKVIEPRLELLDLVFINQNRELEFITALERIASERNVSQKITLAPPQQLPGKQLKSSALQLAVGGDFIAVYDYLSDLETLNYYINIGNIELIAGTAPAPNLIDDGRPAGLISMNISASVYWK
jgi:Tfp pilus assembly protein PilO